MTHPSVTIVGAGAAGLGTAEYLRAGGFAGAITVIGDESGVPYDRPPLSKQVLCGTWPAERATLFAPARLDAIDAHHVRGVAATGLDRQARLVRLADGRRIGYETLVVATGLRPRHLPAGLGLGATTLRTADDAQRLRKDIGPGTPVVVVGGGFLGLEAAASARTLGAEVTVVEPVPGPPLASRIGPLAATRLLALHREHGVDVRTGVGVARGLPDGAVVLSDDDELPADVVLTCIGSTPAVDWLRGSGLDLTDGVMCDEFCAAAPDVWAVGDVANWPHVTLGRRLRLEHRTNATEQARAVAANILGARAPFVPVPFFWSDHFDVKIQVAGFVPADAAGEVVEGDAHGDSFVQTFTVDGRPVGVLGWNAARKMPAHRARLASAYDQGA